MWFRRAALLVFVSAATLLAQMDFVGAGLAMSRPPDSKGHLQVEFVLTASPAEAAGLRKGEPIWSVEGKSTENMSAADVSGWIRGPAGAARTLVVGEGRREVVLTLARIRGQRVSGDCENGTGKWTEPDGSVYEGEFRDGKFHGRGRYLYRTGNVYEGAYLAGKRDGEGKYTSVSQKFTYEGGFGADRFSGQGRVTFDGMPGYRYEGKFAADQPAGPGKLFMPQADPQALIAANWQAMRESVEKIYAERNSWLLRVQEAKKRTLTIDRDAGEPVQSAPKPAPKASAPVAAKPVTCAGCGGTGREMERCSFCKGSGEITRSAIKYQTTPGSYQTRSVYDSTGKLIGQESGYRSTTTSTGQDVQVKCSYCDGKGGVPTGKSSPTCGGNGKVTAAKK